MALTAATLPKPGLLDNYINEIKNHELLTREQEKILANRYRKAHDESAADRLVRANLKLVVKIAKDHYITSGRASLVDLIQEGNVGLVLAAKKFDPDKQAKFSYYASYWIKAYIFKYIMNNYSSVKIGTTQSQRKLFFNLRKTKEKLKREGIHPTPGRIASRVGVKPHEVIEMENRMAHEERSLDAPSISRAKENMIDNLKDRHEPMEEIVENRQMNFLLQDILSDFKSLLDQRELDILERRIVSEQPCTLQKLGDKYGVSRERIRQIEGKITANLRDFARNRIPDFQTYHVN